MQLRNIGARIDAETEEKVHDVVILKDGREAQVVQTVDENVELRTLEGGETVHLHLTTEVKKQKDGRYKVV